jgi:hypothetical protein
MTKVYIAGVVDAVAIEPGTPTHPIAPGGPPTGIWPSPGYPSHPIAPGGPPPQIWPSPGYPSHPIAPGGPPSTGSGPGIWPSPGQPTHPIYIPVEPPPESGLSPTHPIYIPVYPSQGPGFPTNPIAPGGPPPSIWPNPDAIKAAIKSFLQGNLPPSTQPVENQ